MIPEQTEKLIASYARDFDREQTNLFMIDVLEGLLFPDGTHDPEQPVTMGQISDRRWCQWRSVTMLLNSIHSAG